MSTATAPAAPTLTSVAKQVEEMAGVVKSLAERPDYSGVRYDDQGRPLSSGWMDTDEMIEVVSDPAKQMTAGTYKTALKRTAMKRLIREHGYKPGNEFKSFGDFIRAGFERSDAKFEERCHKHLEPVLKGNTKAVQGLSVQDGSGAGYLVMPEFSNQIIDRVFSNDLLSRTDGYTVSGNNMTFYANAEVSRANGSRHGGLSAAWVGEGATIPASKPTVRALSLRLKKLAVIVYLTQELIDDNGFALEQYVPRKVAEEFNFMIGDSLWRGPGGGMPQGFMKSPALLTISKESGQSADTIMTMNVEKMMARFFMANWGNAYWYHNQDILPQLNTMVLPTGSSSGVATYLPPEGLSGAPYGMLKGRPLQPTEFNATLGDPGDLALVDLKQMITITKGSILQAVSQHVEFLTDQLALRFTIRLDGQTWENSPLTPYQGTNTQSSFVVLESR